MKNLVNLTPHALKVQKQDSIETIPASGIIVRVSTTEQVIGEVNGTPLVRTVFGSVEGLPEPAENTLYIVSAFVSQALQGSRADIICPDTGKSCIRENGNIVAITQFTTY